MELLSGSQSPKKDKWEINVQMVWTAMVDILIPFTEGEKEIISSLYLNVVTED